MANVYHVFLIVPMHFAMPLMVALAHVRNVIKLVMFSNILVVVELSVPQIVLMGHVILQECVFLIPGRVVMARFVGPPPVGFVVVMVVMCVMVLHTGLNVLAQLVQPAVVHRSLPWSVKLSAVVIATLNICVLLQAGRPTEIADVLLNVVARYVGMMAVEDLAVLAHLHKCVILPLGNVLVLAQEVQHAVVPPVGRIYMSVKLFAVVIATLYGRVLLQAGSLQAPVS
jgi:hypothetical protein